MIVGNGLIAKEFSLWKDLENVIVFASGVSNSKEVRTKEYKREFDLVRSFSDTSALFIYFSTCSIYDSTLSKAPYVLHKLEIEEHIKRNFKRYLVLRLPNLVGPSDNPHTFFNFIYHSIISGAKINVEKNSTRYFLDVQIVEPIIQLLVNESTFENITINIALNNRVSIPEAISIMEGLMKKKANINILDKGKPYCVPNDLFMGIQQEYLNLNYLSDHTVKCFQKYIEKKQNITIAKLQ